MPIFGPTRRREGQSNVTSIESIPHIIGTREYLERKILTAEEALAQESTPTLTRLQGIPNDVVGTAFYHRGEIFPVHSTITFTISDLILANLTINGSADPTLKEYSGLLSSIQFAARQGHEIEVCGLLYVSREMTLGYVVAPFGMCYQNTQLMRKHMAEFMSKK